MPMPTVLQHAKNIWVAAGEGDLGRVQELIELESLSPNIPDLYTYTPMHAAASYGHLDVLEYLISKGGDVNVKDEDNETPLYTVETVEVARWLVEHGATVNCLNREGNSPAQHLAEDFPPVSAYLYSLDPSAPPSISAPPLQISNYTADQAASQLAQSLLTDAQTVMQRAEAEGRDPETELRQLVGRAVLDGVVSGAGIAQESNPENGVSEREDEGRNSKRPRFHDSAGR